MFGLNVIPRWIGKCKSQDLTSAERAVILDFARGNERVRAQAVEIHRSHVNCKQSDSVFLKFMASVDKVVPDYYASRIYRDMLLAAA